VPLLAGRSRLGSEALGADAAAEKMDAVSDATILRANQKQKQTKKSHRGWWW
jgi:hypothetical protein